VEQSASIAQGLQWLGGGVLAVLAVFGAGNLILAVVKRYWSKHDIRDDLHASNQGKAIDQDVEAFKRTDDRLTRLEAKFDKLQEDHNSLMVENAGLKAENEHLKEKLAEVTIERGKQRDRITELEGEVRALQNEARLLQGQVSELLAIQRGEK
jgi:regulator of replication initiation timing